MRDRCSWEPEPETLEKAGNCLGLHLEPIALTKGAERLRLRLCDASELNQLAEELFETSRGDDFEQAGRLITCVPERVPLIARFKDGAMLEFG